MDNEVTSYFTLRMPTKKLKTLLALLLKNYFLRHYEIWQFDSWCVGARFCHGLVLALGLDIKEL
jgi:hypothetical protein